MGCTLCFPALSATRLSVAVLLLLFAVPPVLCTNSQSPMTVDQGHGLGELPPWGVGLPCLYKTSWRALPIEAPTPQQDVIHHPAAAYLNKTYKSYHKRKQIGIPVPMPIVVKVPSGEEVVVCLNRKVASSRWNHLFLKSGGWDPDTVSEHELKEALYNFSSNAWTGLHLWDSIDSPETYIDKILRENRGRSFIFVRNPYIRLLSGFLHKVAYTRSRGCFTLIGREFNRCPHPHRGAEVERREHSPEAFAVFVDDLYSHFKAESLESVNNHIKPLSLQCGLQHGLRYSYILKLEEEHLWYPELIRLWGMEDLVSSGWAKYYSQEEFHPEFDCLYRPAWMTCAEMNQTVYGAGSGAECVTAGAESSAVHSAAGSGNERPEHFTGASMQLNTFYTPRVAEMVREMFQQDFDLFGYDTVLDLWRDA